MSPVQRTLQAIAWLWCYFPALFGYAYAASLLALGGFVLFGDASPAARTTLVAGLWGYAALGILNFYVVTVFTYYVSECYDDQTFRAHLRHTTFKRHRFEALMSLAWPLNWHLSIFEWVRLARSEGYKNSWVGFALSPSFYWLGSLCFRSWDRRREGRQVETVETDL
jgi:hypothetical protein